MGEDLEKKIDGGQLHYFTREYKRAHENLHRNLEMPESSTGGLGAGKKGRS
jgi:hypothetical protein